MRARSCSRSFKTRKKSAVWSHHGRHTLAGLIRFLSHLRRRPVRRFGEAIDTSSPDWSRRK